MLFFTALSALLAVSGVQATRSLSLSIGGADAVNDVDNFSVTTTITNTGDETLTLFADPRSALTSFPANSFTVTDANGATVPFVGAKAKYVFRTAKNFVVLAPGESKTVTHDLSASYNFSRVGDYEVEGLNVFHYQDQSGNPVAITADLASTHNTRLSGNLVSTTIAKRSMRNYKRATFRSCSSTRQSQINAAIPYSKSYLSNSISYLNALTGSTTRYSTWFGTYSSSRKSTVLGHFNKIQSSDVATYTYDCTCTDADTYAYVYPNSFGIIYLCGAFWSTTTGGTDSRAGTIIHEASHFTANGGTQDYAYGHTNAKNLARSNPSRAVMNADSHEYFAENTPVLS